MREKKILLMRWRRLIVKRDPYLNDGRRKRIDETNKNRRPKKKKKRIPSTIPRGSKGHIEDPAFYNDPDKSIDLEEALREQHTPHTAICCCPFYLKIFIFSFFFCRFVFHVTWLVDARRRQNKKETIELLDKMRGEKKKRKLRGDIKEWRQTGGSCIPH